jgi:hypothetical protein
METLPTIYDRESPRQEGTNDGEMWDSLTDDAGVMPPAHAKAIEAAAEQLEVELMSGRQDFKPRGNSFDSGLAGGNMNQHETYEEVFAGVSGGEGVRDAMIASGHITDSEDTPPVAEWRLEHIGGTDVTAGARAFENIIGLQLVKRTGKVSQTAITKRRLLDSLQVLQHMRDTGNYEALEHLHPEARRRLMEIAGKKDQTFPKKVKGITGVKADGKHTGRGGKTSTFWSELGGFDSVDEFQRAIKGQSRRFRAKRKGKDPKFSEGGEKPTLRARLGEAIMAPGAPAAWRARRTSKGRKPTRRPPGRTGSIRKPPE